MLDDLFSIFSAACVGVEVDDDWHGGGGGKEWFDVVATEVAKPSWEDDVFSAPFLSSALGVLKGG